MPREEKKYMIEEIAERLKKSDNIFVTGFTKLKATDMNILREQLEEVKSDYFIIKNRLAKLALKDAKLENLDDLVDGTTSFALAKEDPVAPAKVLVSFAKEHEGFNIRGGFVAGKLILEAQVKQLATLPPHEVLLAQVVGGIKAPLSGLVFTLSGLLRGLVCALNQIREKKGKEKPQGKTEEAKGAQEKEEGKKEEAKVEEKQPQEAKEENLEDKTKGNQKEVS